MDRHDAQCFRLLSERLAKSAADEMEHMISTPSDSLYPKRVATVTAYRNVQVWMNEIEKSINSGEPA